MHWDGVRWKVVPMVNPGIGGRLTGIAAITSTDAWAVGRANHSLKPPFHIEKGACCVSLVFASWACHPSLERETLRHFSASPLLTVFFDRSSGLQRGSRVRMTTDVGDTENTENKEKRLSDDAASEM